MFPTGHVYCIISLDLCSLDKQQQNGCVQSHHADRGVSESWGLLDQHSLVGQQLQLNPSPFWSAQICKLLQHVNV